jgi:hypothetical protein
MFLDRAGLFPRAHAWKGMRPAIAFQGLSGRHQIAFLHEKYARVEAHSWLCVQQSWEPCNNKQMVIHNSFVWDGFEQVRREMRDDNPDRFGDFLAHVINGRRSQKV